MRVLLRSVILCTPQDDKDLAFRNYQSLVDAGTPFDVVEDITIWDFVQRFAEIHHHAPSLGTLRSHFEHTKETEPLDRLEVLAGLPPIYQGDFLRRLEEKTEERKAREVVDLLHQADQIIKTGLEIREGKERTILKGPVDAMRFLTERAVGIISPTFGGRLGGEALGDAEGVMAEYDKVKSDPSVMLGQFSGITQLDEALHGAKKKELWTHAAFTGHLKSSLALNWAYNQAVYMRHSSLYFSLEMPYEQCRKLLVAMHTMHGKFKSIRQKLGIQRTDADVGVDYRKIRDGILTPEEEHFVRECVVPDLLKNSLEYGKIHIEGRDPMKSEFRILDARTRAEVLYQSSPFSTIFFDHMLLVSPKKWVSSTTDRLNEVIRDSKILAMDFNRGQGIAVIDLFQINREGYAAAIKNGGTYNLTHLSYANEAERSSDVVTYTWIDEELRERMRVKVGCLKTRDDAPFADFYARVEWPTRRILTSFDVPIIQREKKKMGDAIDNVDRLFE